MTENKPIMIDVNMCKYRDKCTNFCLAERNEIGDTYTICTGTDCYFKQHARKTQECEGLKKIINEAKNSKLDLKSFLVGEAVQKEYELQLDQLKAENDYLKHKIFRYEEIFKHSAYMITNPVTAIEVETFQSGVKALGESLIAEENNKLHKTLTEIKEIAEYEFKELMNAEDYHNMTEVLKQILQIIDEVE